MKTFRGLTFLVTELLWTQARSNTCLCAKTRSATGGGKLPATLVVITYKEITLYTQLIFTLKTRSFKQSKMGLE